MRFIVMMDLVSTLILPVTVAYVGAKSSLLLYILLTSAAETDRLLDRFGGRISLVMIGAVFDLQALAFNVHPPTHVGLGLVDGVFYSGHPDHPVFASDLLFLADGRLLVGF
jgi:Chitin synthase